MSTLRPCQHPTGPPQPESGCQVCWLYAHDDAYRRLWDGLPQVAQELLHRNYRCRHLGAATGQRRQCLTCAGGVEVKLFACAKHGACTTGRKLDGIACCPCPEYEQAPEPYAGPVVRNLLYHLYPRAGRWRPYAALLRKHAGTFNGKKVVAVAAGQGLDPPGEVKGALAGLGFEFLEAANDPRLREVVTWVPLWERVRTRDPDHLTWYAHSKGITHAEGAGVTVHDWHDAMVETLWDHPHLVEEALTRFPVAGSFKKVGQFFPESAGGWHYSGSFFAVRNHHFFRRNWQGIDRFFAGSEAMPGKMFAAGEAACVFFERRGFMDLYCKDYWDREVLPELDARRRKVMVPS